MKRTRGLLLLAHKKVLTTLKKILDPHPSNTTVELLQHTRLKVNPASLLLSTPLLLNLDLLDPQLLKMSLLNVDKDLHLNTALLPNHLLPSTVLHLNPDLSPRVLKASRLHVAKLLRDLLNIMLQLNLDLLVLLALDSNLPVVKLPLLLHPDLKVLLNSVPLLLPLVPLELPKVVVTQVIRTMLPVPLHLDLRASHLKEIRHQLTNTTPQHLLVLHSDQADHLDLKVLRLRTTRTRLLNSDLQLPLELKVAQPHLTNMAPLLPQDLPHHLAPKVSQPNVLQLTNTMLLRLLSPPHPKIIRPRAAKLPLLRLMVLHLLVLPDLPGPKVSHLNLPEIKALLLLLLDCQETTDLLVLEHKDSQLKEEMMDTNTTGLKPSLADLTSPDSSASQLQLRDPLTPDLKDLVHPDLLVLHNLVSLPLLVTPLPQASDHHLAPLPLLLDLHPPLRAQDSL